MKLLPKIAAELKRGGDSYRVVVVDDGSYDGTPELLDQYRKEMPLDLQTSVAPRYEWRSGCSRANCARRTPGIAG